MIMMFMTSSLAFAAPAEMTVMDKVAAVEGIIYGTEQTGAVVERINKLEKDIYGTSSKEALLTKMDKIYIYVKENSVETPSLIVQMNAAEWTFAHRVSSQPLQLRLDNLERSLMGGSEKGSINDRMSKLLKMAYANGQVDVAAATLNKDMLIKIKLNSALDTRNSRVGDEVLFEAAEDVYSGGILVIAKGVAGKGKITKIEPSKNFGRDAQIEVGFDSIATIDGSTLDTFMGEKAKKETLSLAKAAGATVAGMVILGPIGVVGGAFVQGKDTAIPAGTEMYIQTKADNDIFGLNTASK
jgi:uncharacterized protein (UPF0264 family)